MEAAPTKTGMVKPEWRWPVFFRDWQAVLKLEPFTPAHQATIMRGIIAFLAHCRKVGRLVSIAEAKEYLVARRCRRTPERKSPPAANIYSIVVSCQRCGLDPLAYLKDVLTRLPAMTNQHDFAALTPARWQPPAGSTS